MHYLFTYGTLQDKAVQQQVFGRLLTGTEDVLSGYTISSEKIMDKYLVVEETNDENDQITGIVYELTQVELAIADLYEGAAYKKTKVTLRSGNSAWVYTKA